MAAQEDRPARQADQKNGLERRAFPRHAVDCSVAVSLLTGAAQIAGKIVDLSQGGCRIITEQRFLAGVRVRVEMQFQLLGTAFRIVGVTVSSREARSFTVRFVDMPARRRDELAALLAEVAVVNAAKPATTQESGASTIVAAAPQPAPQPIRLYKESGRKESGSAANPVDALEDCASIPAAAPTVDTAPARPTERRAQRRHAVDTSAKLLLVHCAICMPGQIVNLSLGGCRLRTEERFTVGIYVRVEAEFYLHGLPFRLAGVSQAVMDKNTIGVRFLDMSERKREQLTELIAEIAEARAIAASPKLVEASLSNS